MKFNDYVLFFVEGYAGAGGRIEVAQRRGNTREASLGVLGQKSGTLLKIFCRRIFAQKTL